MKRLPFMLRFVGAFALMVCLSQACLHAAPSAHRLITPKSVGPVRLGMTVATASPRT